MKSFKDMFSEAKVAKGVNDGSKESGITKAKSEDELHFVKKHIATKQDHPVAPDDQFSGEIKGKKRKPRIADVSKEDGEKMYEMTDAQKLKRDEIVSSMTAKFTTVSEEEVVEGFDEIEEEAEEISEDVLADLQDIVKSKSIKQIKFKDGKKQKVDLTTASGILQMHKALNTQNKKKVEAMLNDSKKFVQILQFAMQTGPK
jgi:hypothetical protein|tara:strand:+ start:2345 stop:2947 length:603 start_codon:yes stop_codon:yes gene_type:complete